MLLQYAGLYRLSLLAGKSIYLPAHLDGITVSTFAPERKNASTGTLEVKQGYPFVFKLEPPDQEEEDQIINLYDLPATHNTVVEALKLYIPQVQAGQREEVEHLEHREPANFAKELRFPYRKTLPLVTITLLEKIQRPR